MSSSRRQPGNSAASVRSSSRVAAAPPRSRRARSATSASYLRASAASVTGLAVVEVSEVPMEIAGRRMARRRPDVTMAGHGMPLRPSSVGSFVFVGKLAKLASLATLVYWRRAASRRRRRTPPAKTERRWRSRGPRSRRAWTRNPSRPACRPPATSKPVPRPARPTPSASPTACTCARPAARWWCSRGGRVQVDGAGVSTPDPKERHLHPARARRAGRLARPHLLFRRLRRLRAHARQRRHAARRAR